MPAHAPDAARAAATASDTAPTSRRAARHIARLAPQLRRRPGIIARARSRVAALALVPVLVAGGGVAAGVWGASVAAAAALPDPTATLTLQSTGGTYGDADDKPFILAGEDATFDVSLTNAAAGDGFNIGFTLLVPNGVAFVSSGMGSPTVYLSDAVLPNSAKNQADRARVPQGSQLWVFEDVADLPGTADYASTITVRPDAGVFPVGAEPPFALTGYISADPAVKPIFDGSTGVGGQAALQETSSGTAADTVPVRALRLTKHEPSPEIELLRGVHDHPTTYTLTVENTPQGVTEGLQLIDYLPAGLEFLACGEVENTDVSPLLYDAAGALGGSFEYPGSGPLGTATAPADCILPAAVETVDSSLPAGLDPGVYTKVTWNLPALSGATAQSFPANAGVAGSYVLRYVAAVPLFENTMTFVTTEGEVTPTPESLAQGANLNNNTGASTRQGLADGFNDGILYDNRASVVGSYAGPVTAEPARAASDADTERIQAMDLRILKSVRTEAPENQFDTGELATFTLDVATSEYTDAESMTIVDTFPNGLCPAFPAGWAALTGDPLPADCAYPSTAPGATLTGATVDAIDYDAANGTFAVTYTPDPETLTENDALTIVYTGLMRAAYDDFEEYNGPTSSGDSVTNTVTIEGWTNGVTGIPAADGREDVWDDSSAAITSQFSAISKRVLARDAVVDGAPPSAATSCAVAPSDPAWAENHTGETSTPFHLGDMVCYELTVDFAELIDVRNPKVTDFLPEGVAYRDQVVYTGSSGTTAGLEVAGFTQDGKRLQWQVGTPGDQGDRFVGQDSRLVVHVLGEVTSMTPNSSPVLDKPENLMKYQQENVLSDLFYLRDASAILTGQSPTLLKGVKDVDGEANRPARSQNTGDGAVFDSNRDGIRVEQGDQVTYRVDLTGGDTAVTKLVVWDALPAGITKTDVTGVSDGGAALNPGDAGYPTGLSGQSRSVILWTGIALGAAEEKTLTYDVTMPVDSPSRTGVEAGATFRNTASITQFDVVTNTGAGETFYPTGSLDTTTRPGDQRVPGDRTRDDSDVYLKAPTVAKKLVTTEIGPATDPNNAANQAVEGEFITWQYSVEVPQRTTVVNGVLSDRATLARSGGNVPYTVESGSWQAPQGVDTTGFTFEADPASGANGVLRFPATYTNTTDAPQVFTVELVMYVGDAGNHNTQLTNRADFASRAWSGGRDAQVTYIEPNLQIDKSATPAANLTADQDITYTLTVTNPGNRPKAYDDVVVDTVPAGLIIDANSISPAPASTTGSLGTGGGGTITWQLAEVPPPATLTYTARITPETGAGRSYTNTVTVNGYTLPGTLPDADERRGEREDADDAVVTAVDAGITKGVRGADATTPFGAATSAPIGATVEYQVQVALEANIAYYDPRIIDDLPAGVSLLEASIEGPSGIAGSWTRSADVGTNTVTWAYDGDIAAAAEKRTLTLRYDVRLTDAVAPEVNDLDNVAAFTWNAINGDDDSKQRIDDDADVDVLNPVLAIAKDVSDEAPDPGETFDYTVTVTNTGDTAAYNLVITDDVPEGVVVDQASISDGGVLDGATGTGGGTITWRFDADGGDALTGPLHQAASAQTPTKLVLTYDAVLADSDTIAGDESFTNVARVDRYESFPEGGRGYEPDDVTADASVDPVFPFVTVDKTVTGTDVAYADQPFSWTLSLQNTGDGAAHTLEVTDVLPKNWAYDAGSATISRGGAPAVPLADPAITTDAGAQTLVWSPAKVSPTSPALPAAQDGPADETVITFTATPSEEALVDAGVTEDDGTRVPHVNTLRAVTTDPSGATGNEDGPYTGPDDDAEAYLHAADLALTKVAADDPLVAGGAAAPAWTITVTNDGPDTAVGSITVTDVWGDDGELPEGVTVTGYTGDGWSCTAAADDSGFACTRTDAAETLDKGESFPSITVTARAAAGVDPAEVPVANTATVRSDGTHDPDPENDTDSDDIPVVFAADLRIVKEGPAVAPNAGGPISWTLTVTNDGPADSRSTAATPVTVTDVIPEGVGNVTVATLPAGWTSDAAGPLQPGDELTLTLAAGQSLATAQSVAFTLTGTVEPSLDPGTEIVNAATVTPGETRDPNPENNTDDTTVTPTTDTALAVAKTRVVQVNGAWVPTASLSPVPAATPGTPVTYLVTVTNAGTADARGVTITDQVAPYLTYTGYQSVTGTWLRTSTAGGPGDDQAFALEGDLPPAASASFRVTFGLAADHTGTTENVVVADAENAEPEDGSDDSNTERSANLSIVKSHTGDAVAGGTVPYTVVVTNEGPSDSSGPITVTDTLPAGFTYVAGSAQVQGAPVAPAVAGQDLTWSIGDAGTALAPGATVTITFTAAVDAGVRAGTFVNTAVVAGPDDDDPTDNRWDDPTPVTTSADVSIVKSVSAGPWIAGESVTYTLEAANAGPSVARDVSVSDILPAGLTLTAISGDGWTCEVATGACARAELAVGSSTITLTAAIGSTVAQDTALVNTATVTASTPDPDPSDNTDDAEIRVDAEADLRLVKTAVDAEGAEITTAVAGTEVRYALAVTNAGPSAAVGPLTLTDTLPGGFTYTGVAGEGSPWTCTADGEDAGAFTCTLPSGLAAGASAPTLTLVAAVDAAQPVDAWTNTATVTSPTTDPTPEDNTDDATVEVTQQADLSVTKSHEASAVRIGDPLTFTLEVRNAGPSDATEVTVTDTLPAGLSFLGTGSSDPAWTVVAAEPAEDGTTTVTATLVGPLAAGTTAPPLQLTTLVEVTAYRGAGEGVTNVATVTATQPDPDQSDNSAEDPVTVPPLSALVVEKAAVGSFQVGSDATYRLTVTNRGPTEDPGPVVLTDELPAGLSFRSAAGAGATCEGLGQTVTCTLDGALAVDGTVTVTVTVAVGYAAYPQVTNTATVTTPTDQTPDAQPTSSVTVPVAAAPLGVTGSAAPGILLAAIAVLLMLGVGLVLLHRRRPT